MSIPYMTYFGKDTRKVETNKMEFVKPIFGLSSSGWRNSKLDLGFHNTTSGHVAFLMQCNAF